MYVKYGIIQIEAARIATGTPKLVLIDNLFEEIGCDQLEEKAKKAKPDSFLWNG